MALNEGVYLYEEIPADAKPAHRYRITPEVHRAFIAASGDVNPLHTDDAFAREAGFEAAVMHGAILNAFISHFVGMRFPGKYALLHSVDVQYKKPNYLGDEIGIEAVVDQKVDSLKVVILKLTLRNLTRGYVAATASVQSGVSR